MEQEMQLFAGLDIHADSITGTIKDENGNPVRVLKVETTKEGVKKLFELYNQEFEDVQQIITPEIKKDVKTSYHLYIIKIKTKHLKVDRDRIMNAIQAENIGVGIHFKALHLHEFYKNVLKLKRGMFLVAEYVSDSVISLPLYPKMSEKDAMDVVNAVKKVINWYKK